MKYSDGPLDNQTKLGRQNGRLLHWPKCSYVSTKKQTLEDFVAVSRSYAKFDCPVARQNFPLLATAHDCETGDGNEFYSEHWSILTR